MTDMTDDATGDGLPGLPGSPRFAVIGGTGLGEIAGAKRRLSRGGSTRWGSPSASPVWLDLPNGGSCWFLPRHGVGHAYAPHRINYRANIQALADLGVTRVLAVAAVGGIRSDLAPGDLVLVDDLIDDTWGREHTFGDGVVGPLAHIEFAPPFDERLRAAIRAAAAESKVAVRDGGIMAVTQGPRLETAAEVRRLGAAGADVVGMTTMPEASLAREAGLAYASLAVVVNPAAGTADGSIHAAIAESIELGMSRVRRLLPVLAERLKAD